MVKKKSTKKKSTSKKKVTKKKTTKKKKKVKKKSASRSSLGISTEVGVRKPLSNKQQMFVYYYVNAGMSGAEAARRAGYSERSAKAIASENLTKPDIIEVIEIEREKLKANVKINTESLVKDADIVKQRSLYGFPQYDEETGNLIGFIGQDDTAALRSIETQGKLLGLINNKVEVTGRDGEPIKVESTKIDLSKVPTKHLKAVREVLREQERQKQERAKKSKSKD